MSSKLVGENVWTLDKYFVSAQFFLSSTVKRETTNSIIMRCTGETTNSIIMRCTGEKTTKMLCI